jgi:hypothetical protein
MNGPQKARAVRGVWGVKAPNLASPFWPRLIIDSDTPEPLIVISHRMVATLTHFIDERTTACTAVPELGIPCKWDHVQVGGGRYEGWLAVFSPKRKRNYVVSLTKVAVKQCPQLELDDYDLRGRVIQIYRAYSGKRAPMRCRLRDDVPNDSGLILAPSLPPIIERMWAADDRPDNRNRQRHRARASSAELAGIREAPPDAGVVSLGDLFAPFSGQ